MNKQLNIALLLGSIYFYIVSALHFIGFKIPMFFVYYDVDSTVYQDRIISVLSFIFATFIYSGFKIKNKELTKYIIFSGFVAVFGLAISNFLTRSSFRNNPIYWLEIGLLTLYVITLYILNKRQIN